MIASYVYDSDGQRTSKTTSSGTTTFTYNESSDLLLIQSDGTSSITFITEPESYGKIIGMVRDGQTYYFLTNAHSDVLAVVDESGKIVASWEYDSFGNPKEYQWVYDVNGTLTAKNEVPVGTFGNPYLYLSCNLILCGKIE